MTNRSDQLLPYVVIGMGIGCLAGFLCDVLAWEALCLALLGGACGYAEAVYRRKI